MARKVIFNLEGISLESEITKVDSINYNYE